MIKLPKKILPRHIKNCIKNPLRKRICFRREKDYSLIFVIYTPSFSIKIFALNR